MTKFTVNISVQTMIMKTLSYPTVVLTISKKECNILMTRINSAALPKMGICRTISHAYLYGPIRYQGTAFPNLYTELCIERLKLLLNMEAMSHRSGRPWKHVWRITNWSLELTRQYLTLIIVPTAFSRQTALLHILGKCLVLAGPT